MKFRAILVLVVLLMAAPAFAQKVFIDYDKEYDLDNVKTFAWVKTSETSLENADPLLHSRLVNGIEYYLTQAELTQVAENPDVYVTYHTSTKEEMSLNTTNFGYGYPGGWGWGGYGGYYGGWGGGMGTSTTTVSKYEIGTLVIDVWDAASKNLVWRGTATNITVTDNPAKMEKRIDKALAKIVKQAEKIRDQRLKE